MSHTQSDPVLAPILVKWFEIANSISLALIGSQPKAHAEKIAEYELRVAIGEASEAWLRAHDLLGFGPRWETVVGDLLLGSSATVAMLEQQREAYHAGRNPEPTGRDVAMRIMLNLGNAFVAARQIYCDLGGDPNELLEIADVFSSDVRRLGDPL